MPNIGLSSHQLADIFLSVGHRLRIAWPIRQKNAVRLQGQHILRRGLRRHHGDAAGFARQHAQDVVLDAKVIGHYMQIGRRQLQALVALLQGIAVEVSPVVAVPLIRSLGAHHLGQIGAIHLANAAGLEDQLVRIRFLRRNDAAQRTMGAQMANHSASVDLGDHRER